MELKDLINLDIEWCEYMNYFNPYIDPFNFHLSPVIPPFDKTAYLQYPRHNFVYDKLFIAQSQGLLCGKLESLLKKDNLKHINFPIFIKPRWGHKSASSKNCFKIKNIEQLKNYKDYKNMMWSEFIDAKEVMTDYVVLNGKIVHQITYVYSDKQNGYIDDWKVIDCKNKPPDHISEWVIKHMTNYTGICNVQYRGDKIIEVGLRCARGGAYINSIQNKYLTENINKVVETNNWNYGNKELLGI